MADVLEMVEYDDGQGLLLEIVFDGDTLWMTIPQIADLFKTNVENVRYHVNNIYGEKELDRKRTSKDSLEVVERRPNYRLTVYNLDVVISVGYRIKSAIATQFRQWATQVIRDRLSGDFSALAQEEALRLLTRVQIDDSTTHLISLATDKHKVVDKDSFLAAGDYGLYRMSREEVEANRDIPGGKLYDYIGSTELGMHVYRLTQTAEALNVDAKKGYRHSQQEAESIHEDIATRTRAESHKTHGQYPEELPKAKNIELVRQKQRALLKRKQPPKIIDEQTKLDLDKN